MALVGRDEELAFTRSALADFTRRSGIGGTGGTGGTGSTSGRPRTGGLVVAAPAGIGKTALVSVVARQARERGLAAVTVTGSASARNMPLGPFAPLLPSRADLGLPRQRTRSADADPADVNLLRAVRGAVLARDRGHGLLLVVDDAHQLDGPSAVLVRQLTEAGQVFLVAALRPELDVPADIRALWKDGTVQRIELTALSRAESVELAETVLGGPIGGALAESLWQTTTGNPLYLRELIHAGLADGAIQRDDQVWVLTSALRPGTRLPVLLADRLADLSDPARHAAEVLAVAGRLPLVLAERVIGAADLMAAEATGLVAVETTGAATSGDGDSSGNGHSDRNGDSSGGGPDGSAGRWGDSTTSSWAGDAVPIVTLSHPLYAELLREQVPVLRARQVGREVAAAMRALGADRSADRLRCLVWELDGGVPQDAVSLLAGAAQAVEAQDPALAERLARAALTSGAGRPGRLALADALYRQGKPVDGLRALGDDVGDGGTDTVTDEERTQIAVLRVYLLNWGLGDFDGAADVIEAALQAITDTSCRAWLVGLRASMDFFAGRPRDAVARAEPLLTAEGLSTRARLGLSSGLGPALSFCGRYADAERLAQDGLQPSTADQDEVPVSISWAVGTLEVCYIFTGRVTDLERLAGQAYQAELLAGHDEGRSVSAACLGHAALSRGQIATALRWLAEAHHTMGPDWGGLGLFAVGTLARAQVLHGDLDAARDTIDEVRAHTVPAATAFVPVVDIADAWLLAAKGRLAQSLDMFQRIADDAADLGRAGFEVEAWDAIARLGEARAAADRLTALAEHLESPLARLCAAAAIARAAGDATGLDTAAQDLAAQQLLVRAGSAAAAAGALHQRAGRTAAAAASRERATAWLSGFDGVLPPDVTAWSTPQLTARERQVCLLAAAGSTSREIADELVISVRTVDAHLAAAYTKFGISGRAELGRVLMVDPNAGSSR